MAFAVGDRIGITENTGYFAMVGCYGHVIETRYWASPPLVIVDLKGRVGQKELDKWIRKLNPWPIAVDEIEHVD